MNRNISQIAQIIGDNWQAAYGDRVRKPQFILSARYVLKTMRNLESASEQENYNGMNAQEIVTSFLRLTSNWRGAFARAIKNELKSHLERDHLQERDQDQEHHHE